MLSFLAGSGTRLFDLLNREMGPDQLATLHALRTGESVRQQQEVIRRPDGSSVAVLVNAIALDSDTFPYLTVAYDLQRTLEPLVLVVLQDVSALKEAEQLKDEFIAMAAHELRNPIAMLAGYTQLLTPQRRSISGGRGRVQHRAPIEWQVEAVTVIQQASERLTALTDDLLDATRLHANRLTLRPEPTELGALVRRVVKRAQVTTKRHTLMLEVPSDLVLVEVDVQRVEQVLINLLSNAIKYSPDGGAIHVTLSVRTLDMPDEGADGAHVADAPHDAVDVHAGGSGVAHVAVRDQGIGIPIDEQARIFGRFARAENARQQGIPGTGLGLYLCRALIELHNGHIWFESVEGAGTTFTVELPVWHEPEEAGM
jgi:signal transduction histidine kinase